jgi:hypothetical protein
LHLDHFTASSFEHGAQPISRPVCDGARRIGRQVAIALSRGRLSVPQQLADNEKAIACRNRCAGEGVAQVMDAVFSGNLSTCLQGLVPSGRSPTFSAQVIMLDTSATERFAVTGN